MVDIGARKIGLLSRSTTMSPEVRQLTEEVASLGAEIFSLPCDVTNKLQLQEAVDQCAINKGSVKGVINAAMVFKVCELCTDRPRSLLFGRILTNDVGRCFQLGFSR
jgi:NAD(P)-dependent dehydrogenase (short-subunit alcohol dehydrogenase family)